MRYPLKDRLHWLALGLGALVLAAGIWVTMRPLQLDSGLGRAPEASQAAPVSGPGASPVSEAGDGGTEERDSGLLAEYAREMSMAGGPERVSTGGDFAPPSGDDTDRVESTPAVAAQDTGADAPALTAADGATANDSAGLETQRIQPPRPRGGSRGCCHRGGYGGARGAGRLGQHQETGNGAVVKPPKLAVSVPTKSINAYAVEEAHFRPSGNRTKRRGWPALPPRG